ncbi:bifunctional diaminohydroxyphosphoribosylaminopyrimidine deaminase/5-amino-6-(5-phosphoribosylamino)uracil reductase RibD [Candidatus Calescamantes bacterium]|nr:bifunctional diaminohydroxyphosphoribosylaminopyrimidine deaminase/5-amino-6-(5-phosphoribosylamino)uracil reductase RibD [Candidatus Calescamantes bacterium]
MKRERDKKFMREVFHLAEKGRGTTSPNPMVGAVVVKGNRIVGRGYHKRAGSPHAEVIALKEAGEKARGAILYINLEPCVHYGRTPPCAPRIIEAGVKRVVISMLDPNPKVKGRGVAMLREAGIDVEVGIEEEKARELNEFYIKHITTGLPFIILKWAMSLDGKIATYTGDSRWISGEKARVFVHSLRNQVDGIIVGIGTVLCDNPILTVRKVPAKKQPLRIIIDPTLSFPLNARMLKEKGGDVLIFTCCNGYKNKKENFLMENVEVIPCGKERVDIENMLKILGKRGVTSLLVEGGNRVFTEFLEKGLVDKIYAIVSPVLLGGEKALTPFGGKGVERVEEGIRFRKIRWLFRGEDVIMEGYPKTGGELF